MAVSDDDGTAERLAQVRAQRRHVGRLRVAERRDAAHEGAAAVAAEGEAEQAAGRDPHAAPAMASADARTLLIAEEAALELDRAGLAADREAGNDVGVEMDI
jgi:hypothetical protein